MMKKSRTFVVLFFTRLRSISDASTIYSCWQSRSQTEMRTGYHVYNIVVHCCCRTAVPCWGHLVQLQCCNNYLQQLVPRAGLKGIPGTIAVGIWTSQSRTLTLHTTVCACTATVQQLTSRGIARQQTIYRSSQGKSPKLDSAKNIPTSWLVNEKTRSKYETVEKTRIHAHKQYVSGTP